MARAWPASRDLIKTLLVLAVSLKLTRAFGRSVAIVVNFGDQGSVFENTFAENTKRAAEVYRGLGYDEVLVVPPTVDMRTAVAAAFKKVGRADQLDVETMGHGAIDTPPPGKAKDFPPLEHAPSAGLYDDKADSFHFHNGSSRTDPGFIAAVESGEFAKVTLASQYRDDVGAGSFAEWVKQFRRTNPKAPVKISLVECYAGHAARTLERIPGVHAYAASGDRLAMSALVDAKRTQFYDFYLDQLGAAKTTVPRPTELDTFEAARAKWIKVAKQMDAHLEVPWSPVDTFVNDWCAQNPAGTSKVAVPERVRITVEKFSALKHSTEASLKLEQEITADQNQRRRCEGTDKVRRLTRAMDNAAILEKRALDRLSAINGLDPVAQTAMDHARQCLARGISSACELDTEFPRRHLPEAWRDQGNDYAACASAVLDTSETCLAQIRNATNPGVGAFAAAHDLRAELVRELGECDRPEPNRAYAYYKACYDRFWSTAGDETLGRLADLGRLVEQPVGVSGATVMSEAVDKTSK